MFQLLLPCYYMLYATLEVTEYVPERDQSTTEHSIFSAGPTKLQYA